MAYICSIWSWHFVHNSKGCGESASNEQTTEQPSEPQPNTGTTQTTTAQQSVVGEGGSNRKVKTYQTYTKTNPETGEVYSGRTSGYGNPAENVRRRDANHHMNRKGFGPAVLDKSSTNYNSIRGREQLLIEKNGGAKSTGGTSGNAINGIGKNNKKKSIYINSAIEEFGGFEEWKKD